MKFDDRASRRVEAIYLAPDVVGQRGRVLDALALARNEHRVSLGCGACALARARNERVVDLGCGPGLLALEMAHRVGMQGEVQGIDNSDSMIALAARR